MNNWIAHPYLFRVCLIIGALLIPVALPFWLALNIVKAVLVAIVITGDEVLDFLYKIRPAWSGIMVLYKHKNDSQ